MFFLMYVSTVCIHVCVCACVSVWCFHTYVRTFVACIDVKGHWALCFINLCLILWDRVPHWTQSYTTDNLMILPALSPYNSGITEYMGHICCLDLYSSVSSFTHWTISLALSLIPSHSQFDSHWFRHILLLPTILPIIIF